jgi:hypothetical protein
METKQKGGRRARVPLGLAVRLLEELRSSDELRAALAALARIVGRALSRIR